MKKILLALLFSLGTITNIYCDQFVISNGTDQTIHVQLLRTLLSNIDFDVAAQQTKSWTSDGSWVKKIRASTDDGKIGFFNPTSRYGDDLIVNYVYRRAPEGGSTTQVNVATSSGSAGAADNGESTGYIIDPYNLMIRSRKSGQSSKSQGYITALTAKY